MGGAGGEGVVAAHSKQKSGPWDSTSRCHVDLDLVFVTFIKQIWLQVNLQGMPEVEQRIKETIC